MSKNTENDILGEVKSPGKKAAPKVKLGDIVIYHSGSTGEYPAIVTKVHDSGALNLSVFVESYVHFTTKIPFSDQKGVDKTFRLK